MAVGVEDLAVGRHDDVWREPHGDADDQSEAYLADHLIFAGKTLLVVVFQFAVVVERPDGAHPDGGHEHQDHVYIAQIAQQQAGQEYGENDDDAPHGGCAALLHLAFEAEIAHLLANLHLLEASDDGAAQSHGQNQRKGECDACAKRDEVHQMPPREICRLEILLEDRIKHFVVCVSLDVG